MWLAMGCYSLCWMPNNKIQTIKIRCRITENRKDSVWIQFQLNTIYYQHHDNTFGLLMSFDIFLIPNIQRTEFRGKSFNLLLFAEDYDCELNGCNAFALHTVWVERECWKYSSFQRTISAQNNRYDTIPINSIKIPGNKIKISFGPHSTWITITIWKQHCSLFNMRFLHFSFYSSFVRL